MKHVNLQLFADGTGGAQSAGTASQNSPAAMGDTETAQQTAHSESASNPTKQKNKKTSQVIRYGIQPEENEKQPPEEEQITSDGADDNKSDLTYEDLIKSDKYRDEHKKYMERAISDRLKKYKGIESELDKAKSVLEIAGSKYGLDIGSDTFVADLKKAIEEDDSYFEEYASNHDVPLSEAKKVVTLERRMATLEKEKQREEEQNRNRERIANLVRRGEETKKRFPSFNLENEMEDPRFVRLVASNGGDTTAAYIACHYNEIIPQTVQFAENRAAEQTANAVKANALRPVENGLSAGNAVIVKSDPSKLTLEDFRRIRDNFQKTGERPKF